MLVALKAVPRALCGLCGEWLLVYCVLRPLRGSLRGFILKDGRLYLLVLFCSFRGFKTLEAIKKPPVDWRLLFWLLLIVNDLHYFWA